MAGYVARLLVLDIYCRTPWLLEPTKWLAVALAMLRCLSSAAVACSLCLFNNDRHLLLVRFGGVMMVALLLNGIVPAV